MNEFIVWDSQAKKFINENNDVFPTMCLMYFNGKLVANTYGVDEIGEDIDFCDDSEYEAFNYIGKTDDTPEKNKIYADCSIVEFEYYYGGKFVKMQGYFQYHLDELRQEIHLTKSPNKSFWSVLSYDMTKMQNFRVIGTLQEDKHLLEN